MTDVQSVTIMNDFLFSTIMRQEKYCKPLLELILDVKIKKLVYLNIQQTIDAPIINGKSIRLDVYVEDEDHTVYNIEVQTSDKRNLGKRTRFYQAMIDVRLLESGVDYSAMKASFVIFICNYDPFKKKQLV